MIYETMRGKITALNPDYAVLEVNGIGYKIFIPINLFTKGMKINAEMLLYISHIVREDSEKLFGFATLEERNFFEKLCSISGVGAKTALAMIGHMGNAELRSAIEMGNATLLSRIPGIGKKTAERIIVDLSDSMHKWRLEQGTKGIKTSSNVAIDALQALINLGYNRGQAQKAVSSVLEEAGDEPPPLSNIITKALKLV